MDWFSLENFVDFVPTLELTEKWLKHDALFDNYDIQRLKTDRSIQVTIV